MNDRIGDLPPHFLRLPESLALNMSRGERCPTRETVPLEAREIEEREKSHSASGTIAWENTNQ